MNNPYIAAAVRASAHAQKAIPMPTPKRPPPPKRIMEFFAALPIRGANNRLAVACARAWEMTADEVEEAITRLEKDTQQYKEELLAKGFPAPLLEMEEGVRRNKEFLNILYRRKAQQG